MIGLTKIAGASTILSMVTAAVLLVGCGGGSNNAKQPSPTAQPTAGHATNGAAGKGAQSAAPSPEACTVKVAGHCVVVDPNKPDKAGASGQSGAAAQSGPASGNNQPASKPRASATPSGQTSAQTRVTATPTPMPAGRQNAQPAARGQNGKPSAFSGQPSAQD